jgi:UDP-2,3-diacylglucosamine hydrolase
MTTLFISDLHLDASRPRATETFLTFLRGAARDGDALYILGDLFEAWIGDDDPDTHSRAVIAALAEFTATGIPCFFAHGNRDFLVGSRFAAETGVRLLGPATVHDLHGRPTLLMHGDQLCTDDHAYQRMRRLFHTRGIQQVFLGLPSGTRRWIGRRLRTRSQRSVARKAPAIMDVNPAAVQAAMREHGVTRLIHGHTHRPAQHRLTCDGRPAERIVLGDWYTQGSVLRVTADAAELATIAFD